MSFAKHRWFRYVPEGPAEGRSDPVGDFRCRWPLLGRIGYCADGADWRDAYILVVPFDKSQNWWDVVVRGVPRDQGEGFSDELFETELLTSFLAANPVVWAPAHLDALVETHVFGWRAVQRLEALKRGALRYTLGGLRFAPVSEAEHVEATLWPRGAGEDASHSDHDG